MSTPTPPRTNERYLKLPHAYWEDGWHLRLELPAKVMLLIALSLTDGFPLPAERAHDWYGISPDTAQRGVAELAGHGLLDVNERFRAAPLSEIAWTSDRRYTLQPLFRQQRRAGATVTKLHA